MTIHAGHPFPTPDDPVRRLRGRLGGTVSLWTAGDDVERAGLTVTSWLVAGGEPGRVIALLDPDADLTELLVFPAGYALGPFVVGSVVVVLLCVVGGIATARHQAKTPGAPTTTTSTSDDGARR